MSVRTIEGWPRAVREPSAPRERPKNSPPFGVPLLLCSRTQAAALLNIGPTTLDRLRKNNHLLRPVYVGSRPLWPYKNLVAFVDELIDAGEAADPWESAAA